MHLDVRLALKDIYRSKQNLVELLLFKIGTVWLALLFAVLESKTLTQSEPQGLAFSYVTS